MKSVFRYLLRAYLSRCPVTEGKGLLYRRFAMALLPAEREVIAELAPGFRIALDLGETAQREMFYFGTYERKESALVRRILRPGDAFWDVGANLGYYTLLGGACVGKTGRVVAFEPFPPAWERLQRNLSLNAFPQARLVNAAVSSVVGTAPLFFASDVPDGVASLAAPEGHVSRVTCRTLTLDRFAEEDGERLPTLMKVDVEGHGTSKREIQEMLSRLGYAAYQLWGRRWVACEDIREARFRNIFWAIPTSDLHRARLRAADILRGRA
ncbi:MAG: FkbM family methyltransferase [candidate division NC10 bacterium]|nr:FkbM family methyltransferase [candidate division NC10 bacterium]